MTMTIPIQGLIAVAANLVADPPVTDEQHEYVRGQVELINDLVGNQLGELDPDDAKIVIQQAILDRAAHNRLGHGYQPLQGGDDLQLGRVQPVTEQEWKREHAAYDGSEQYNLTPRPVIVFWHDPFETPSEAVVRLNAEVGDCSRRLAARQDGA
jgi:hypothetical protein